VIICINLHDFKSFCTLLTKDNIFISHEMKPKLIVILQNLRSLHNVGSIFRTSDAAGVEKIYLVGTTPTPLDRFGRAREQFSKVSLGAERSLKWEKADSLSKLAKELKKDGWTVVAVEQHKDSRPYNKLLKSKSKKVAIILGNEPKGLTASELKVADEILEIPMSGAMVRQAHHPRRSGRGKESLNVSVAAGIVLFQLRYN